MGEEWYLIIGMDHNHVLANDCDPMDEMAPEWFCRFSDPIREGCIVFKSIESALQQWSYLDGANYICAIKPFCPTDTDRENHDVAYRQRVKEQHGIA